MWIPNNVYGIVFRFFTTGGIAPVPLALGSAALVVVVASPLGRVALVSHILVLPPLTIQSLYYPHSALPSLLVPVTEAITCALIECCIWVSAGWLYGCYRSSGSAASVVALYSKTNSTSSLLSGSPGGKYVTTIL